MITDDEIRELRAESGHASDGTSAPICVECVHRWPCPTIRALDALERERTIRREAVEALRTVYLAQSETVALRWVFENEGKDSFTVADGLPDMTARLKLRGLVMEAGR